MVARAQAAFLPRLDPWPGAVVAALPCWGVAGEVSGDSSREQDPC